jgi:hypothetical protein
MVYAQESQPVGAKGQIIDKESGRPIPYARLASYGKAEIYSADITGEFNLKLAADDSVRIVVLGYEPVVVTVNKLLQSKGELYNVVLEKTSIPLKEVTIYNKSANEHLSKVMPGILMGYVNPVPPDLRSEVGGKPSVLAAVTNPLSFAYYHLGKKEKRRTKMRQLLLQESRYRQMSKELVAEISGLKGVELDEFFIYCNANIKVTPKDTGPSIRIKIIEAYTAYKNKVKEDVG